MGRMAKKTGMSDSSLWIVAIVLLVLTAWMYFKR
jgi:LPXTG-motif cell wall-anchored protein